jgi:hypothetical protein
VIPARACGVIAWWQHLPFEPVVPLVEIEIPAAPLRLAARCLRGFGAELAAGWNGVLRRVVVGTWPDAPRRPRRDPARAASRRVRFWNRGSRLATADIHDDTSRVRWLKLV